MGKDLSGWHGLKQATGTVPVDASGGGLSGIYAASVWYDQLEAQGADVLARFGVGAPAAGAPALTLRQSGAGRAIYVAAVMEQRFYNDLIGGLLGAAACPVTCLDAPEFVEITPCRSEDDQFYFVLNHDSQTHHVLLNGQFEDLLHGATCETAFALAAYDVVLLRHKIG